MLADGTVTDIAVKSGRRPVISICADAPRAGLGEALSDLKLGRVKNLSQTGPGASQAELEVLGDGLENEIEDILASRKWVLKSIDERPLDLEEIFAELVRKSEQDNPTA